MQLYSFEFEVRAPVETVLERIRGLMRSPPTLEERALTLFGASGNEERPFIGDVDGSTFNFRRDIRYQNSFLPRISGKVKRRAGGACVTVSMSITPFVVALMSIWLVIHGGWALVSINRLGSEIPLFMFIGAAAVTVLGFIPEALKAKRILLQRVARGGGD